MKKKRYLSIAFFASLFLLTGASAFAAEQETDQAALSITVNAEEPSEASEPALDASPVQKMEGEGALTPQDALEAYIKGLQDNDIDEMMAAFAVETYAINYDLASYVERIGAYMPYVGFLPGSNDFSVRLNIEKARTNIMDTIRAHYLVLADSPSVLGETAGMPFKTSDYDSTQEMFDVLFGGADNAVSESIRFDREFYSPALFSSMYANIRNFQNMERNARMAHAQGFAGVAAKITYNGRPYLIAMDAIQYGTRWYLSPGSSYMSALIGLNALQKGMSPLDAVEW